MEVIEFGLVTVAVVGSILLGAVVVWDIICEVIE